jgi:hypothetical protein
MNIIARIGMIARVINEGNGFEVQRYDGHKWYTVGKTTTEETAIEKMETIY